MFPAIYGKMVFLFFVIVGMLTMGFGFVFPTKQYVKKGRVKPNSDDIDQPGTTELLPSADRSVDDLVMPQSPRDQIREPPSVVERTTRRLG